VTLRGNVVRQVGTDLAGVVSLYVYYARIPLAVSGADGSRTLELPDPFLNLLVLDGARYIVARMPGTYAPGPALVAQIDQEEGVLMQSFLAHAKAFAPTVARFG
jgi:hypothetical protein